jgi:hypothetical protein
LISWGAAVWQHLQASDGLTCCHIPMHMHTYATCTCICM